MGSVGDIVGTMVKPVVWNLRYHFPNMFVRTFMFGMVGSLAMFITSWEKADRLKDNYLDKNRNYGETFDFIVVGGGTAGSIVSNRLSKHYKVLLLEAGGEPHPFSTIPFMANFMSNYKELDWMHTTEKQKHAFFGSTENRARISGGKGLGGSSNLDYMMYLRGNPMDYNHWAKLIGDPSWSYESLLKYFMKHEKYEGPWKDKHKGKKMHGNGGEMRLSMPPYSSLANRFVVAGNEMGYPHVDLNGEYSEGVDMITFPMNLGYRQTAYKSFLKRHAQERWNLVVHKYAHVNKILTQGESNDAYAVEYDHHGKKRIAYARKEIILSAGAIQSPKILMHSNIGPSDHLQSVGIPIKVHLPGVGQNLQDHMSVKLGPFFTKPLHSLLLDRDLTPMSFVSYTMGQGPLTTTGYEAAAMLTSDLTKTSSNSNPHWPDIQLTMYSVALHSTMAEDVSHAHRLRRSLLEKYYKNGKGRDSFSILVSATRPKSKGEVKLRDKDPYSSMIIDPRYLEREEDVRVMVDGIKKTMRMVEGTLKFKEIDAKFTNETVEGCERYRFKSDEYWACYVRVMSISMGDVVGTAAMGSVVDHELRVLGTRRLRVVDASIMPTIVSGGTSAATLMIGEKGADMILNYWGQVDKVSSLANESKNVQNILNQTAQKLNALDTSSIFMNSIKDTPSFRELSAQDIKEALEPKVNDLRTTAGWANIFRPFHNTLDAWGTFNNIRLIDPNYKIQGESTLNSNVNVSPLKLIGTMFRNSLTSAGDPPVPNLNPIIRTTQRTTTTTTTQKIPIYITHPPTHPTLIQYQQPLQFYTTVPTPKTSSDIQTLPSPKPTRNIATLFETFEAPVPYLKYPFQEIFVTTTTTEAPTASPYVLTPKSTPTNPLFVTPTRKTFSSSVDAFVEKYHPLPLSSQDNSQRFSKTLPILGFASVDKSPSDSTSTKYFDSFSAPSQQLPSIADQPPPKDNDVSGVVTINRPIRADPTKTTPSALKVLIEAPLKIVKAFQPLQNSFGLSAIRNFKPLDSIFKKFTSTVSPPTRELLSTEKKNSTLGTQKQIVNFKLTLSPSQDFKTLSGQVDKFLGSQSPQVIQQTTTEQIPKDYEFMEDLGLKNSADLTSKSKLYPVRVPSEESYKIIYEPPLASENVESKKDLDLSGNVQAILNRGKTQEFVVPQSSETSTPTLQNIKINNLWSPTYDTPFSFQNDPKNLDEEVDKLITNQQPIYFVPLEKADNPLRTNNQDGVPLSIPRYETSLSENTAASIPVSILTDPERKIPFTKIIHGILEKHRKSQEKLRILQSTNEDSETLPLIISPATNFPPSAISSNSLIDSSSSTSGGPKNPSSLSDFKALWPKENPKESMSFRIKILNQK